MPDDEEVRRRIVAARILCGIDQQAMSERGHQHGLDKHELARVERGGKNGLPIKPHYLRILAEVLEVPLAWFTEPREVIVSQRPPDYLLEELQALLADLRTRQVEADPSRTRTPQGPRRGSGDHRASERRAG